MKINVTENKVSIKEEQILNENEYNIHKIQFDFSSEYTDDLVKIALFSIDNHTYKKIISNNECDIPPEVLTQRGYSILGVYAYKTEQDTLVLRYSPSPTKISVYDGSYKAEAENSEPITPSEIEQYQQILQNSLQQFQNQYNVLVEETEGDIQAIEDELQRKVDEGYFDGEDGFSPIAKVIQKSNGATIEIEDKNGKTTADVLNGEDGYTPVRGVDYWTEEDKQEVEEEATQQIEGKIEEYNENAAEKLNQYNQNSVQKTNDYNTNAEQKMSAYNTNATEKLSTYNSNATEKFNDYNSNAEQKETSYNTNASQKVESFNTNASSKLSEYNSNAETKKSAYDENATQKTNSFNTNATNKLTEYNTNHTEKMSAYNSNSTQKLNAFNENATQKTEDFDEHTEEIQDNIEILQRTDNQILSRFNKDEEVSGQDITLTGTTEIKFAKPPLPMGNSEQESTTGKNKLDISQVIIGQAWNTGSNSARAVVYMKCEPSTQYTISFNDISNFDGIYNFEKTSPEDTTAIVGVSQITTTKTITTNANSSYLGIQFNKSNISANDFTGLKMQIEEGSAATPYEPYTGGEASPNPQFKSPITNVTGDVEVKVQNKNLADIELPFTTNISGAFSKYLTSIPNIKPNISYTLTGKCSDGTELNALNSVFVIMKGNTQLLNWGLGRTNLTTTDISEATSAYIYTNATLAGKTITEFQIEKNSTSTPYTPHKEQTFTFPLGNEKLMLGDYLADDGIHHVRGQVVLDGSENWANYTSTYDGRFYCTTKHFGSDVDFVAPSKFKCTHFTPVAGTATVNGISGTKYAIYININDDEVTSIETFKAWLSTHNVTVEYKLKEEVIVPYTSAQQEVYNQIKNAYSYDEITIITGFSDGNKPFFIVQTYKDLNKELNNKVDKVQGKELSSNDFTDTLKEKLEGLENYDDTEIKADISDIQDEQTEQNTDIEKLQEENARLKATQPTTTGEGKEVTLNKTAELEFIKPPLPMGNSEQESTTGKNKLILRTLTEQTVNGITFTPVFDENNNTLKYINVNGTATAGANIQLSGSITLNGTFTLSSGLGISTTTYIRCLDSSTYAGLLRTDISGSQTANLENRTVLTYLYVENGTTVNNVKIYPMIEEGSTATSYEPYTRSELQVHHHLIHKL